MKESKIHWGRGEVFEKISPYDYEAFMHGIDDNNIQYEGVGIYSCGELQEVKDITVVKFDKLSELIPVMVEFIPKIKEHGKLYISKEYKVAVHLCACGCGIQTVTPFNTSGEWSLIDKSGLITLSPSIGNFTGESPYHAHYFIRENKVIWV